MCAYACECVCMCVRVLHTRVTWRRGGGPGAVLYCLWADGQWLLGVLSLMKLCNMIQITINSTAELEGWKGVLIPLASVISPLRRPNTLWSAKIPWYSLKEQGC